MKKIMLSLLTFVATNAFAQVTVEQAWVRGTVPAQKVTGAFMTLKSAKSVSLMSVASPAARTAEIHEMSMEAGIMKMRAVEKIDLVPGKATELKPGGFHIMLMDLVKPLAVGDTVPLTLEFKDATGKLVKQEVKAEVRALTASVPSKAMN